MKLAHGLAAGTIAVSTLLIGCAAPDPYPVMSQPVAQPNYVRPDVRPAYASSYGVVDSIQLVSTRSGTSGTGAVAGAVVGGVVGNQIGSGSGRAAATVAGAVGGGLIGNQIEKHNRPQNTMYQIGVRLDDGSYQTYLQESIADLRVGDRIRIEGGQAYRY